ncbi:UDP-glucoronosyl and UDP-glucosyl transferase [Trichostrongylus colubriformis]|uniref:glucuronosyltransferase n=1 Tax=Trichostrongylus colubriformis TaxID=6319 RepID=A0AAN8FH64_TRICO
MSSYDESMTFPQRFINFFLHFAVRLATHKGVYEYEMIFKKHGLISNLRGRVFNKTNYLLSNTDEFLEYSWPSSSKLVHIGGIALPKATPLEEKFHLMMDRPGSEGVVLIAFGSNVSTVQMPNNIRAAILQAVSTFQNYTFIWKIDKDDKVPKMVNLFTPRWIPQASLLRHPNLRCFISHAGLNSVLELTRSGKPAILVPLLGDQYRNAKLVERRGSAIVLYTETFTSVKFIESVHSILEDDQYRRRAERLASLMNRKPFKMKERLLSTVEFSAMHGKIEELDAYSYRMGVVQYFCLDVILVAFSLVAVFFYAVTNCTWKFLKHTLNRKGKID